MDESMNERMGSPASGEPMAVLLTVKDITLLRTGLEMLQDTFGHEEAEELAEVQALLAKLPSVGEPAL